MALERDQAVFPGLPVFLLAAKWTVPVEELEVVLQDGPDLHLPLHRAAGVQEMDHRCQALQAQPRESGVLGFRGGPAAPCSQDREEVIHRVRSDGKKTILLQKTRRSVILTHLYFSLTVYCFSSDC